MPYRVRARAAGERPAPPRRSVTRLRLTCLYGGVFMVAGTAFLVVALLLAEQAVSRGSEPVLGLGAEKTVVLAPADCPGPGAAGRPPARPPAGSAPTTRCSSRPCRSWPRSDPCRSARGT